MQLKDASLFLLLPPKFRINELPAGIILLPHVSK